MQCPACGHIQDDKQIQCENCKLIFSKYSPDLIEKSANEEPCGRDRRVSSLIGRLLFNLCQFIPALKCRDELALPDKKNKNKIKFGINLLISFILIISFWLYINWRRKYLLFRNILEKDYSNIIIAPLGDEMEHMGYIYFSGRISLKNDDSTIRPLAKAVISFENEQEKKEILSQVDGFYEINLKPEIYNLTVFYPELNIKTQEKIDLRKISKMTGKNFIFKKN